ncbi:TPA: transporter substrate-binding domain-containing protein, partial [Clostridioides difficile]|nr:transporter substrate-binding domain-containing protein [Clostridioides difficile]
MKVFKKLLSLGLVLGLTLSLVGCSGGGEKTKLEQIKDNGKLVVGTSAEFPPFEFHKVVDGKDSIKGFDIMLAEEFAKELGVKVEIKDMSFDGLIGALNADQVDIVLAGMSPTPEREKSVDFSELYYLSRNAVIVKDADIDKVKTEDDLKKLRVGVQAGSIQEEYVVNTLKMTTTKSLKAIP